MHAIHVSSFLFFSLKRKVKRSPQTISKKGFITVMSSINGMILYYLFVARKHEFLLTGQS